MERTKLRLVTGFFHHRKNSSYIFRISKTRSSISALNQKMDIFSAQVQFKVLWETDDHKLVLFSKTQLSPKPTRTKRNTVVLSESDEQSESEKKNTLKPKRKRLSRKQPLSESEEDESEAVEWEEPPRPTRKRVTKPKRKDEPTLDPTAFTSFGPFAETQVADRLQNHPRPGEMYLGEEQVQFLCKIDYSFDAPRDVLQAGVHSPCGVEIKEILAYDDAGERILDLGPSQMEKVSFLVLPNGTILSPHSPEPVFAFFEDDDGELKMAPGVITRLFYSQRNAKDKYSGIMVEFKWLVVDSDFDVSFFSLHEDAQFLPELSSLSIECIACNVNMLPFKLYPHLAYNYWCSLSRWNLERHRRLRSIRKNVWPGAKCDVYDALEFYHARDEWIFRTAIGEFIVANYIAPFKQFGQCSDEHNYKLVCDVMKISSPMLVMHEHEPEDGVCEACKLTRTLRFDLVCEDRSYNIGNDCAEKLKYFHRVMACIRVVRTRPSFNFQRVLDLLNSLSASADELRMRLASSNHAK